MLLKAVILHIQAFCPFLILVSVALLFYLNLIILVLFGGERSDHLGAHRHVTGVPAPPHPNRQGKVLNPDHIGEKYYIFYGGGGGILFLIELGPISNSNA